jgi:hypothetical protein
MRTATFVVAMLAAGGFAAEVTGLEPRPFIAGPIDPDDYRLSLLIQRD